MRVLHLVEVLGSGVQAALDLWIRETPTLDHAILAADLGAFDVSPGGTAPVTHWPGDPLARVRGLRRAVDVHRPDVVHAHSSRAGAYGRLSPLGRRVPVVYSPHCFAFERSDLGVPARRAVRQAERIMALRTAAYAVVSEHERQLARQLSRHCRVAVLPVASAHEVTAGGPPSPRPPYRVVAVGRISAQKDPLWFVEVARLCARRDLPVRLTWVGDGDDRLRAALTGAGVTVTGWLTRDEVVDVVAGADVYAHTAAWEGSPVSVEEAFAVSRPVVARAIPALEELGLQRLAVDPEQMVAHVAELVASADAWQQASCESAQLGRRERPDVGSTLTDLYASVVEVGA